MKYFSHKLNIKTAENSFSPAYEQSPLNTFSDKTNSAQIKSKFQTKQTSNFKNQSISSKSDTQSFSYKQLKQKQIFDNYNINKEKDLLFIEKKHGFTEKTLKRTKTSPVFCFLRPPELNKWWLETDSFLISAMAFSKYFYEKLEYNDKNKEIQWKEITKILKNIPKMKNILIKLKKEEEIMIFSKIINFFLYTRKKFLEIRHLRILFDYSENPISSGIQFIKEILLNYHGYYPKNPESLLQMKYFNEKYPDIGLKEKNIIDIFEDFSKSANIFANLLTFQCNLCSWFYLSDEIFNNIIDITTKIRVQDLQEISLFFSGSKITDQGIEKLMKNLQILEFHNLKSVSLGFDTRNDKTTDNSLISIIETILLLSQKNLITNLSICLITKNMTNYGVWCLFEGLMKISHRLDSLTLILGNDNKINRKSLKNLKSLILSARNLMQFNFGILSSKLDCKGLLKILQAINLNDNIRIFNLFYSNKGGKSTILESQSIDNLTKFNPKINSRSIQVFLD